MAGAAASESILFIGAMIAAAVVAGTLSAVAADYAQNLDQRSDTVRTEMTGRIAIVNDPANVPDNPVILYVKNIGLEEQDLAGFNILIDGSLHGAWTATVGGVAADVLKPGDLAEITLTGSNLANGDHTATVISDTNYVARLEFSI